MKKTIAQASILALPVAMIGVGTGAYHGWPCGLIAAGIITFIIIMAELRQGQPK